MAATVADTTHPLGITSRNGWGGARGALRHAGTRRLRTRTGETFRALCGAGVYLDPASRFDPDHPRACPRCRREVRRG